MNQYQKPRGLLGRFILWEMNARHAKLTDWGLAHTSVEKHYIILDVGCGGGRTVSKLAGAAAQGKVYGIDFSEESVAASTRTNASWIDMGRAEINHGCVSASVLKLDVRSCYSRGNTLLVAGLARGHGRNLPSLEAGWQAHRNCGSLQGSDNRGVQACRKTRGENGYEALERRRASRTL